MELAELEMVNLMAVRDFRYHFVREREKEAAQRLPKHQHGSVLTWMMSAPRIKHCARTGHWCGIDVTCIRTHKRTLPSGDDNDDKHSCSANQISSSTSLSSPTIKHLIGRPPTKATYPMQSSPVPRNHGQHGTHIEYLRLRLRCIFR